jgi:hypothetical protein
MKSLFKKTQASPKATKPRTIQEINQDYYQNCAAMGELEVQYQEIPERQKEIRDRIKQLAEESKLAQAELERAHAQAKANVERVKVEEAKVGAVKG